jgi:hypothetical protein
MKEIKTYLFLGILNQDKKEGSSTNKQGQGNVEREIEDSEG